MIYNNLYEIIISDSCLFIQLYKIHGFIQGSNLVPLPRLLMLKLIFLSESYQSGMNQLVEGAALLNFIIISDCLKLKKLVLWFYGK